MKKFLFITVANNSGSKLLVQLVAECKNVVALPREGERYVDIPSCITRMWTQTKERAKMEDESNYNFVHIKDEWHKLWKQSRHFNKANPRVFLEKSPPNVLRAQMYEKNFPNAYFMIMVRNPYAVVEGILRRCHKRRPVAECTKHWIDTSRKQIENIEVLENNVWFTYEDLCDRPKIVKPKIDAFMPEISDINLRKKLKTHSQLRGGKFFSPPVNLNKIQIKRLTADDIKIINTYLEKNLDLLEFFGYKLI